jgi:uncharacterized protein YcaQ
MRIGLITARRLVIQAQGLDGAWDLPPGKAGVLAALERLGYVQIDTIAVVQRAHHHTLWARCPDYAPEMLHQLLAEDRRVFEYWTHAASYLPMSHYRYYLPRMHAHANGRHTWYCTREAKETVTHVLGRIRNEGPLGSADFKAPEGRKQGPWWDWKPAKRALEMLFSMGKLMVAERRNFHRIYDLTERVLPPGLDTSMPTEAELAAFRMRQRLTAHGMVRAGEQNWRFRGSDADAAVLQDMLDRGEAMTVRVAGLDGQEYHVLADALERARKRRRRKPLHILSPFDNLVIWRRRVAQLFGFNYKLECYTPAAKRKHGYFCLPILWGESFAGRLDAKADRKAKTLLCRSLILEPGVKDWDGLLPPLAARLWGFAAFNGCEAVEVERTCPAKFAAPLRRALKELT